MPELPEVETIRNILYDKLQREVIVKADVIVDSILLHTRKEDFIDGMKCAVIRNISRRGKYLIFELSTGSVVLHLRLDGQLYITSCAEPRSKYTLIEFELSGGKVLRFDDKRKIAKASFIPNGEADKISGVHKLGIEPFSPTLTPMYLKEQWKDKPYTIKEAFIKQNVIAGFGNFYSDELFFICGIHPKKKCSDLDDHEYMELSKNIPSVLSWGLYLDKAAEEEYDRTRGTYFAAKDQSYVYGRFDMPCKVCGNKIKRMKVAGRTSYYCPSCQILQAVTMREKVSEIAKDIIYEVSKYIGAYIQYRGIFDVSYIPDSSGHSLRAEDVTQEEFILYTHEYINDDDRVNIDRNINKNEQLRIKKETIRQEGIYSSDVGEDWLNRQSWKKS